MLINNQSKIKEITSKESSIKGKGIIPNKNPLTATSRKSDNSKSEERKLPNKIKNSSKSKIKKPTTKNVFDEYFPLKKQETENPKQNDPSTKQRSIEKEEPHLSNEGKMGNILLDDSDEEDTEIKRLVIHKNGVAINFDGKQVKIKSKDTINKNYLSYSNSEYALTSREVVNGNNKSKKKFQQKNREKSKKVDSSKSRSKMLKKQKKLNRESKSQEQIKTNQREKYYEKNEKIDLSQIHELIKEDIENSQEINVPKEIMENRKKCIQMISEVCGVLSLRRETFYLSISIFDRVICKRPNNLNDILLSLVSLTLAMKLEQSKLSLEFIHLLGLANEHSSQETYHSESSHQSSMDSKRRKEKKNLSDEIGKTNTKDIFKILKKYEIIPIQKSEFMIMEEKVKVYLRFRLWRIQAIYWADLLTCLWDQLIMEQENKEENISLLFRYSGNLTCISYLYQILELIYIQEREYKPSIHMVLSTMFLLLRITKETHEDGYEFYRKSLFCSTNILFVDTQGINKLFWGFLEKLNIEMIDVVGCCQYISKYLQPELFIPILNTNKDHKDDVLITHQFNQNLYQP